MDGFAYVLFLLPWSVYRPGNIAPFAAADVERLCYGTAPMAIPFAAIQDAGMWLPKGVSLSGALSGAGDSVTARPTIKDKRWR